MSAGRMLQNNPTPIAYRINALGNDYIAGNSAFLESEYGLLWHEWVVIFCLGHVGVWNANGISAATHRPKNTIGRAVNKLVELSYIARTPHPEDARVQDLTLTARGRRLYDEVVPRLQVVERDVFGGLSREEQATLLQLLDKLTLEAVRAAR